MIDFSDKNLLNSLTQTNKYIHELVSGIWFERKWQENNLLIYRDTSYNTYIGWKNVNQFFMHKPPITNEKFVWRRSVYDWNKAEIQALTEKEKKTFVRLAILAPNSKYGIENIMDRILDKREPISYNRANIFEWLGFSTIIQRGVVPINFKDDKGDYKDIIVVHCMKMEKKGNEDIFLWRIFSRDTFSRDTCPDSLYKALKETLFSNTPVNDNVIDAYLNNTSSEQKSIHLFSFYEYDQDILTPTSRIIMLRFLDTITKNKNNKVKTFLHIDKIFQRNIEDIITNFYFEFEGINLKELRYNQKFYSRFNNFIISKYIPATIKEKFYKTVIRHKKRKKFYEALNEQDIKISNLTNKINQNKGTFKLANVQETYQSVNAQKLASLTVARMLSEMRRQADIKSNTVLIESYYDEAFFNLIKNKIIESDNYH